VLDVSVVGVAVAEAVSVTGTAGTAASKAAEIEKVL